ncbi:ATP-binding cassette domain-containing protein [Desulfovibrio aminophilus]|uniref:ABC transporter ATP-binding protein n=1 Tax=Desulfovibrio aminophilus TaxID=81425 RepID=UPI003393858F
MDPIIVLRNLKKLYDSPAGAITVLKGIDLSIRSGEMVAIMGPSGCGKSTLLYILGLLQQATSGEFRLAGADILRLSPKEQAALRRDSIGFVLQSCNLFENTTVYENLEFPLIYGRMPRSRRRARIEEALAMVNLSQRMHQPSNMLSGGEQQRVAIARALINRPKILLADEPTGQLDRTTSKHVMASFKTIIRDHDTAMILVTHDPEVADQCDRACVLVDGTLRARRKPSRPPAAT